MTLDAAQIDLSKTFERGQGYVALSRLKNIENLQLSGFNEMALKVDGLAYKADLRFQELSALADEETDLNVLSVEAMAFIKASGGLTKTEEIEKQAKKVKEKAAKKQSTYEITLTHLRKKLPLKEIAEERGLSLGTISGHLVRLRKDYPKENFDFYRPDDDLMKKVTNASNKLKEDSKSLKAIFDFLKGKVSYEEIRLAMAFL